MPRMPTHKVSPTELKDIGTALVRYGTALKGYAKALEDDGLKEIEVTHESQKINAVKFAKNFVKAVHDVTLELGDPTSK